MPLDLKITCNARGVQASLSRFITDQRVAVARALNKTAMQARTEASRAVRDAGYNIKASAIKDSFDIQRASKNSLIVLLLATGRPIGLINYNASQTRKGVRVKVKSGAHTLRHAFIATMKSGHRGVFVRAGGKGSPRLPIRELYGPSIPTALSNRVVEEAIMSKIQEKFPQILAHEIAFLEMKK